MIKRQGFIPVKGDAALSPVWEWLPAEAITPKLGLALALDSSSGQLEVSVTPQYICMMEASAAVTAGTLMPVMRVEGWEFETILNANDSGLKAGCKRDVYSGGLKLGTGTSNNNFLLTYVSGDSAGDVVRGHFI